LDRPTRQTAVFPTLRVRNISIIPALLSEHGADPREICRRAGVDPAVFDRLDGVIPYASLGRLVSESVKATGCDWFGLKVGMASAPTVMGLMGLVSIHSTTVREGLELITTNLTTSDSGGATFLDVRDGVAAFGYVVTARGIESADHIVDGSLAIASNFLRRMCGEAWRPDEVRLTRAAPRDKRPFARFFGAPIVYGAAAGCLVFPASLLDEPISGRDPHVADMLTPLLREEAASAGGDFVASVRRLIRAQLAAGQLSREALCRALGITPRALVYRLEARGLTYSGLAEEARFEAAQDMLLGGLSIAVAAERLGFADQSAFTRAFKEWSGTTPAKWRADRGV